MIRSLTRQDYDVAQVYLDKDPLNNVYLIHGLQTQRFETLWGAFDDDRVDPETDRAGVVESARTLPEFRGRGMYPSVRTACVEYLSEQGKVTLGVIKDDNIAMRKVIGKCGGSLTDPWLYVRFKGKPPLRRRIFPPRLRRWASRIRRVKR